MQEGEGLKEESDDARHDLGASAFSGETTTTMMMKKKK